jgi:hypothetical protein
MDKNDVAIFDVSHDSNMAYAFSSVIGVPEKQQISFVHLPEFYWASGRYHVFAAMRQCDSEFIVNSGNETGTIDAFPALSAITVGRPKEGNGIVDDGIFKAVAIVREHCG